MPDLTVTLIQAAPHWEDVDANLQMLDRQIDRKGKRTELIILPEMFTTGFSMQPEKFAEKMDGKTMQWMKKKARESKAILTGSLMIEENGHYFNRLLWVLPDGQVACYDKRHLFTYAGEHDHYTPGNKKLIARVKGWKICLAVCYDLRFPVWLRQPAETANRYDLLICVANWPESRADAWKILLQARAVENQCYVAGVNRTGTDGNGITYSGDSCIIDPAGRAVSAKKADAALCCTLHKEVLEKTRKEFPFLEDADRFLIL